MKLHAVLLVQIANEVPDLQSENSLHWNCLAPDHMYLNITHAK
jgi:hypothetical protein